MSSALAPGGVNQQNGQKRKVRPYDSVGLLLPEEKRQARVANWTNLAKKYGHPVGIKESFDHRILRHTGKSGLTPNISSPELQEGRRLTRRATAKHKQNQVHYQKQRFRGFTAHELNLMEAWNSQNVDDIEYQLASVSIHPVFQKARWTTSKTMPRNRAPVPILGTEDGFWDPDDKFVWSLMLPSLKLASLVLHNAKEYPWLDGLFYGKRTPIIVEGQNYKVFHTRPREVRKNLDQTKKLEKQIMDMAKSIRWELSSGYEDEKLAAGMATPVFYEGHTHWEEAEKRVTSFIAYETLQALVREDLTDSEKIAIQFRFATLLLHEFAHGAFHFVAENGTHTEEEFYFERERIAELGFSFESKVWGGECLEITGITSNGGPGLPVSGIFKTNWCVDQHALPIPPIRPILLQAGEEDKLKIYDRFPVPVSWVTTLFKKDLWTVQVRRYGLKASAMRPLTFGIREEADAEVSPAEFEKLLREKNDRKIGPTFFTPLLIDDGMPEEQRSFRRSENARRIVAGRIYDAISDQHDWDLGSDDGVSDDKEDAPVTPRLRGRAEEDSPEDLDESTNVELDDEPENDPEEPEAGRESEDVDTEEYDTEEYDTEEEDIDEETYDCPRWEEIKKYLIRHCRPRELAIETMGMMSEQLFLKYIKNLRGSGIAPLNITPLEFRNFLGTANKKRELFIYEEFPGSGTVTRIKAGWPKLKRKRIDPPIPLPSVQDLELFEDYLGALIIQEHIYKKWGELRDIDIDLFQRWLDTILIQKLRWTKSRFLDVVVEGAREKRKNWVLGPEGIIRLTFPVDELRNQHASSYVKRKVARDYDIANEAWGAWEEKLQNSLRKSSRVTKPRAR